MLVIMKSSKQFNIERSHGDARRGVALLIVLGLLGLLLISAVAFAVLMRTERSAATNYRHTSSARSLLNAAFSRVIEEINADIGDNLNPNWEEGSITVGTGSRARPRNVPEGVMFSYYDVSQFDEDAVPARILTKDVMTYIPARFHRRLTSDIYDPPEWLPIRRGGSILGRYAYAVIDSSGMLDANMVGKTNRWTGATMDEVQLDPSLLGGKLGSVKDLTNKENFIEDRDDYGRFETIAELASLNRGIDNEKLSNFDVFSRYSTNRTPEEVIEKLPVNLFGLDTAAKILAKEDEIMKAFEKSGISLNTLVPLTSSTLNKDMLRSALIDYIDDDSVVYYPPNVGPTERFNRPCTEMLPLPVAVGIRMSDYKLETLSDTEDGTQYRHTLKSRVYLNISAALQDKTKAKDGPWDVRAAIYVFNTFAGEEKLADWHAVSGADITAHDCGISVTGDSSESLFTASVSYDDAGTFTGDYDIFDANINSTGKDVSVTQTKIVKTAGNAALYFTMFAAVEIYNRFGELCYQFPGGKQPEQFKNGLPSGSSVDADGWAMFYVSANLSNDNKSSETWVECVDPRFAYEFPGFMGNDNSGKGFQWYCNKKDTLFEAPKTRMSNINGYADKSSYSTGGSLRRQLMEKPSLAEALGLDKERIDGFHHTSFGNEYDNVLVQERMYLANAPIESPGELGYLLLGPWETIKLYDHWPDGNGVPRDNGYHKVLDYFEVRDPAAEPMGKVNINSASEDVLSMLFLNMPLRSEQKRGSQDSVKLAITQMYQPQILGQKLRQELDHKVTTTGLPISKLSDLAYIYARLNIPPALNPINPLVLRTGSAIEGAKYTGEFEREAVIRNVANLLTTKQQLFTIVLRADAFTTRFGSDKLADGTVLSSITAIAQVFRDPVATEDGGIKNHDVTIRLLKILE